MLYTFRSNYPAMKYLSKYIPFMAGISTFLPIGILYLTLILLLIFILVTFAQRSHLISKLKPLWLAIGIYTFCGLVGWFFLFWQEMWFDSSASRLFHIFRTVLILMLGLLMLTNERYWAVKGFVTGALLCLLIYLINIFYPLPYSIIWHNMLSVTGNASSQKMILLACASSYFLYLALKSLKFKLLFITLFSTTTFIILFIGLSRNAQFLAFVLPILTIFIYKPYLKIFIFTIFSTLCLFILFYYASELFSHRINVAISEFNANINSHKCEGSTAARMEMARVSLNQMLLHPLTGTGIGSWLAIWPSFTGACPMNAGLNNPHNDYALAGMETGFLGLLSILWLYFQLFKSGFKNARNGNIIPLLFITTLAISSLFNGPLRDAVLGMAITWMATATLHDNDHPPSEA